MSEKTTYEKGMVITGLNRVKTLEKPKTVQNKKARRNGASGAEIDLEGKTAAEQILHDLRRESDKRFYPAYCYCSNYSQKFHVTRVQTCVSSSSCGSNLQAI
eukprot:g41931.t1